MGGRFTYSGSLTMLVEPSDLESDVCFDQGGRIGLRCKDIESTKELRTAISKTLKNRNEKGPKPRWKYTIS